MLIKKIHTKIMLFIYHAPFVVVANLLYTSLWEPFASPIKTACENNNVGLKLERALKVGIFSVAFYDPL